MKWTQEEAIELCRKLEEIAPQHGAHVALTGGCLYKTGTRKDADIMFYRVRGASPIDAKALLAEIEADKSLGITVMAQYGWLHKAVMGNLESDEELKHIDFFFPEEPDMTQDEYETWRDSR